jgi:hypothetical protein
VIFVATKKGRTTIFCSTLSFGDVFGSGIRDKQHCNTANRINVPLQLLLCNEHRSETENSDFSEPVLKMMTSMRGMKEVFRPYKCLKINQCLVQNRNIRTVRSSVGDLGCYSRILGSDFFHPDPGSMG